MKMTNKDGHNRHKNYENDIEAGHHARVARQTPLPDEEINMTAPQKLMAERIYEVLTSQTFADFYGSPGEEDHSPLSCHIMGDENCKTKEQILEMIVDLFNI